MTKPIPPRFPAGSPQHIRTPLVRRPKERGEKLQSFTAPARSATYVDILFEKTSAVRMPRFKEFETSSGRIKRAPFVRLPDPYSAIRYSVHQRESVKHEKEALETLHEQLTRLHYRVERDWRKIDDIQKKEVRDFIQVMAGAIGNPKLLKSFHKKQLQKRLVHAVELLKEGKDGAAVLALRGAANDAVARQNQLVEQQAFLERRHDILAKRTTVEQKRLQKYIDSNFIRLDILRNTELSPGQLEGLLKWMVRERDSMHAKREPELKEAAILIGRAERAIRAGRIKDAYPLMRQANRRVIHALGRQYLMTDRFLPVISQSSQETLRKTIFEQQLTMLAQNAAFWFDRASNRENMTKHLIDFARHSTSDLGRGRAALIRDAAYAAQQNMPSVMEEKLMRAAGIAA